MRLNRAVQRATIYPAGHPSVELAVRPVVEALSAVMAHTTSVSLLASRRQVLVACGERAAEAHEVPWLSGRIVDRGVASLVIRRALAPADAEALVGWLAAPPGDAAAPRIPGVDFTWRDYAAAQFSDEANAHEAPDALLVWQQVVHGLTADWLALLTGDEASPLGPRIEQLVEDPVELARFVRRTLFAQEGTGIAALAERLVSVGGRLAAMDEVGQAIVCRRLAAFITELAPELRGQLLRITPGDAPEKLQLLSQVIDELPRTLVLEVIEQMDVGGAAGPPPLLSLFTRMVQRSSGDPYLERALGDALSRSGLPPDVVGLSEAAVREALEAAFRRSDADPSMNDDYQRQIDDLSAAPLDAASIINDERLSHTPEALSRQVSRIALALVASAPGHDDAPWLVRSALGAAPAALADRDVDYLGTLAQVALALEHEAESPKGIEIAAAAMAFFERPETIACLLDAATDTGRSAPASLSDLLRAGGSAAADAALAALAATTSAEVKTRLSDLLSRVEPERLKTVLATARAKYRIPAPALVALLCHERMSNGAALAELFLGDADADVRHEAFRIAFRGELSEAKLERLARRALEDADPRVAELGVIEVGARDPAIACRVLDLFLGQPSTASLEPSQRRAVSVLANDRGAAAGAALADALAHRGRRFDAPSRRVSRLVERELERRGDELARRAAARWRRSPAGIVSFFLRDRVEDA